MIVPRHLVGYVDTVASPAAEPGLLGSVTLSPDSPVEARAHTTLTLRYTVGQHGLDDRGAFKILMRFPMDGGVWQLTDPAADNFVSVTSTGGCQFQGLFESFGDARPWFKVLRVRVVGGCLRRGEVVTVTLGDTSGGSAGLRMQTFCEDALELRFLVDVCATGHFVELPQRLSFPVVPGPAHRHCAVLPTRWAVGEPFWLGVKAEDAWGNPTDQAGVVRLSASLPVEGLPETLDLSGQRAVTLTGLIVRQPGTLRITVTTADDQASSNPLILSADAARSYWGDLHGQSGETVGINSARRYLEFARDLAFLDITSHQGNAFQINAGFWQHLNELTAALNAPGRFLAIPGYEWSGNTAVGGDRNIYFRHEHRPVRRSSHALLTDRSDIDTDCTDAGMLFEALQGEAVFAYAHVGGRYADLTVAHDGRIERSVEIHSAWGTFTWLLHDALSLGHRVGVVANSDGHKGRPGASYPGAATFGAYGGLTCFRMADLTRDALFDCIQRRRHYGTTGTRIDVDQQLTFATPARRFHDDPALVDTDSARVHAATMGDIVQTEDASVQLTVSVKTTSPIERIEVRVGAQTHATLRPYRAVGSRIRVIWQGAKYRGRGRSVRWDGDLSLSGATIARIERINAWNPDHAFSSDATTARWQAITTGNFGGLDLWLTETAGATLTLTTPFGTVTLPTADIGIEDTRLDYGGLDRAIRLYRLPEDNDVQTFEHTLSVPVAEAGDTPIWLIVTTEDGHQAFTSPTYVFRSHND
ncbi:MAG: DUF3604 domain-containing protein [Myxococcota bacterium]|nr:DUF3604 domain-containing protein [Myxococcota bacterium]